MKYYAASITSKTHSPTPDPSSLHVTLRDVQSYLNNVLPAITYWKNSSCSLVLKCAEGCTESLKDGWLKTGWPSGDSTK